MSVVDVLPSHQQDRKFETLTKGAGDYLPLPVDIDINSADSSDQDTIIA
jgi:hypothetical protein